jgi:PQQ-dependent dehydrogenase (s-GDH family)
MRTPLCAIAILAASLASAQDSAIVTNGPESFAMRIVATGFDGPWELTWGPDGHLWITERRARRVVRVNPEDGARNTILTLPEVHQSVGQDGLLGMALHPDLLQGRGNDFVYLAFTYDDAPGPPLVRKLAVRRYRYDAESRSLRDPRDLLTGLPAHDDHVGGRLIVGPDLRLYLSVGDQGSNFGANRCNPNLAQRLPSADEIRGRDWTSYQGKILRIELDGSIPPDNPELQGVRSHVFSYGHRNQLGLAFDPGGRLYESEHGPSTDDEVNLIEAGRNYGWPDVAGYRDDKAYVYANWSQSTPQPCRSLPQGNTIPPSVPTTAESSWNDVRFAPPLRTFFTVDSGSDVRGIGSATIAPGGLEVYAADGIAGWRRSLLVLSLIRGVVYRVPLSADGRSVAGSPSALFPTANRYRDIAIDPGGRTIYLATDAEGPSRGPTGAPRPLANPGSVLEFRYRGGNQPREP